MAVPLEFQALAEKAISILDESLTADAPSEQQWKRAELAAKVLESYSRYAAAIHGVR